MTAVAEAGSGSPITIWVAAPLDGDGAPSGATGAPSGRARTDRPDSRRVRRARVRSRSLASRALLRVALADRLGTDRGLTIARRCPHCGSGGHGPPYVAGSGLHLSVSRASGAVAVAISPEPIGVDLEFPAGKPALASAIFSTDQRSWLESLPPAERSRRLVEAWTAKEAIGKLCGLGLIHADRIEFALPGHDHWTAMSDNVDRAGSVRRFASEAYVGALASRHPHPVEIRLEPARFL